MDGVTGKYVTDSVPETPQFAPIGIFGGGAYSLASERFTNAQQYADGAFAASINYMNLLSGAVNELKTQSAQVSIDRQTNNLSLDGLLSARPALPSGSDMALTLPDEAVRPTLDDVHVDGGVTFPAFDVPPVVIDYLQMPLYSPRNEPVAPNVDLDVQKPARPEYSLPLPPTLYEVAIPAPPDMSIADFDGIAPLDDIPLPSYSIDAGSANYGGDLQPALKDRLISTLQTGTVLSPEVEQALMDRENERALLELQRAKDRVASEWATRGFPLPDGALSRELTRLGSLL